MKELGKLAMTLGAMTAMLGSNSPYSYFDEFGSSKRIGSSQKDYKNKNANIEYYTDEKGNIRKRKLKMAVEREASK